MSLQSRQKRCRQEQPPDRRAEGPRPPGQRQRRHHYIRRRSLGPEPRFAGTWPRVERTSRKLRPAATTSICTSSSPGDLGREFFPLERLENSRSRDNKPLVPGKSGERWLRPARRRRNRPGSSLLPLAPRTRRLQRVCCRRRPHKANRRSCDR